MAMTITIHLSDAEAKALATVAVNPADWADNVVRERCRLAMDEIIHREVNSRLAAGEPIPASREAIVMAAEVKTIAEQNAMRDIEQ